MIIFIINTKLRLGASPKCRGLPPLGRTIPWSKHSSETSGAIVHERRSFDVSSQAVTMETTTRFKSLPDTKAPDLHVATNFHGTLTILDILNSNTTIYFKTRGELSIIR